MALTCLALPAISGNYASAPDSTALSITGSENGGITLIARVALGNWVSNNVKAVISKFVATGNQRSFQFGLENTGNKLFLNLSSAGDGATVKGAISSVAPTVPNNEFLWILASWRVSDGRLQFFTAPGTIPRSSLLASHFSILGTDCTISVASIFNSTAPLEIGSISLGTNTLTQGKFANVIIYNGVFSVSGFAGDLVFDKDFTDVVKTSGRTPTTTTESSPNGATVTINGTQWDWYDGWSAILVTSLADNVDRTSYSTASWTPAPNRLIKVDVGTSVASGSAVAPTLSGNGITWEKVAETTSATSTNIHTFVGKSGASPSAGALTADFAGVTQDGCSIHVTEIDGADLTGVTASDAMIQANPAAVSGQASPYSRSLTNTPLATSRCFSSFQINLNSALTPRTNWTELSDAGFTTPTRRLQTQWRGDSAEQTADVSGWASTTAVRASIIEIKAAPIGVSVGINAGVSTKSGTTFSAGAVL